MSDPLSLIGATAEQTSKAVIAIGEEQTGLYNRAPTGVLRGIWETIALVVRRIYAAHVTPMYAQADRSRAAGPWLRMHAAYLGVQPLPATAAQGSLQALSPAPVLIDADTPITVQGSTQRLLVTAATQLVAAAPSALPVRAESAGAAGNIAPGSLLMIDAAPAVTVSAPKDWITTPGADTESDAALRRRLADRWASLGAGQPEAQYRYVAESRPGIARAIVIRTPRGPGSVDLSLISTAPTGVPSAAQIADVTQALESLRMICRDLRVVGGAIVPIRISVLFEGDYTAAQVAAAIEQGMDDAVAAGVVHVADIYAAAVAGLPGLRYFGVASPLHDIEVGPGSVPDLTVIATMGRVPTTHVAGGGATTGGSGGPQPITDSLAYGVRTAAGVLTPQQPPKAPIASGQWALVMPALAAGDTWYFGPLPTGVEVAGVEQFTADVTADWQLDTATGAYIYAHGATVPPGVQSDIVVTARRTT